MSKSKSEVRRTYVTEYVRIDILIRILQVNIWYLYIPGIIYWYDKNSAWYQLVPACNPSDACGSWNTYHDQALRTQNGYGPEER